MKFVHIADMHFDSPFTGLSNTGNLGDIRRLEQRKIFSWNKWEWVENENTDIYRTAFTDFYENQSILEKIQIKNPSKINILLTHCDLNGSQDENGFSYHPILESKLNALDFDYVAMGHIHKTNFAPNKKIIYPGSTISFGFDETGEHGMVARRNQWQKFDDQFCKIRWQVIHKTRTKCG